MHVKQLHNRKLRAVRGRALGHSRISPNIIDPPLAEPASEAAEESS